MRGRLGVGAKSHCNHGPGVGTREFIDWRPFSYVTSRIMTSGGFITVREAIETIEFTPRGDGGTLVCGRIRVVDRGWLLMLALKPFRRRFRRGVRDSNAKLQAALEEDIAAASG